MTTSLSSSCATLKLNVTVSTNGVGMPFSDERRVSPLLERGHRLAIEEQMAGASTLTDWTHPVGSTTASRITNPCHVRGGREVRIDRLDAMEQCRAS